MDFLVALQIHLKANGHNVKVLESDAFLDVKNTLDSRMKDLSKQGKIAPHIKAEPISTENEEKLWQEGVLGENNQTQLVSWWGMMILVWNTLNIEKLLLRITKGVLIVAMLDQRLLGPMKIVQIQIVVLYVVLYVYVYMSLSDRLIQSVQMIFI